MIKTHSIQYTLRGVPRELDRSLRARAAATGSSVNQQALEALARGLGQELPRRDLSFVAGSMSPAEGQALEVEVRQQRQVDPGLW